MPMHTNSTETLSLVSVIEIHISQLVSDQSRAGKVLRYAAMASRSLPSSFDRFSWTATIEPPTVSNSGVKPLSR